MANFATHTSVAATLGGALAGLLFVSGEVSLPNAQALWLLFIAGTLLPDIDLGVGRPVRWLFHFLALMAALVTLQLLAPVPLEQLKWQKNQFLLPDWQVGLAAVSAWLLVRFPLRALFRRFSRHRGLCHSLLVGAFWSLCWVYLAYHFLLKDDEWLAWLQGLSVFLGFILHLLLDELYSVDLTGMRLKRSFGSAFKLYQRDFLSGSLVILIAVLLLVWQLPYPESLIAWMKALYTDAFI